MAKLVENTDGKLIDYMAKDYGSLLNAMRELIPEKLPEWTDYESEADFGNVLLQLFAYMGDVLSYYQDRIANEGFLSTAKERRSIIDHLGLIGYKLSTAAPASTELSLYFDENFTDDFTIHSGVAFATKSTVDKASVRFEYTGANLLIPFSTILATPENIAGKTKLKKRVDIPIEEGRSINDDVIGTSSGTPNQKFLLSQSPLILRSFGKSGEDGELELNRDIKLLVELGGEIDDEWTLQESFAYSNAGQKDYVIEIDENDQAYILFGDGKYGAIPETNSVITASYRVGGGTQGNVTANTITTILNAPQLVSAAVVIHNVSPATGGADRETIDHAIKHAPKVYRSLKRAVSAQDYEALALRNKAVGKVRAEAGNWNTVNLFVAPAGGGYLSDTLIADLRSFFEDKRPVSTMVEFYDVDYVDIFVTASVEIESYYSNTEKRDELLAAAGQLLAFEKVDFKQPVYLSKFYEALELVTGVKSVVITEFRSSSHNGLTEEPLGKIELGANEIAVAPESAPYNNGNNITVTGGY